METPSNITTPSRSPAAAPFSTVSAAAAVASPPPAECPEKMKSSGRVPWKPAAAALAFSADRSPTNRSATACCISVPDRKHPGQNRLGNELSVGATTMLLVCWASWVASPEYNEFQAPKPCCSQITPWASIVPSALVGKYQSAGAT